VSSAPEEHDGATSEGGVVVAAFDFDGTLTRGGSVWSFLVRVRGPLPVARAALSVLPRLVAAALFGGAAADRAKEALFARTLAGLDAAEVAALGGRFGPDHYRRRQRADVRARVEQHRAQGHRLVIVSASPELYVGAVGAELGFDGVVATRLEVGADGRLTGRYEGPNCRGAAKLDGLRRWTQAHAPGAVVWAYGNSAGDRPLLGGADVGVDVGRLGPVGKLRAFRRMRDAAELKA
jgi:phosphatidylglycerophosphatase C